MRNKNLSQVKKSLSATIANGTNYSIEEIDKKGNKHTIENMKPISTRKIGNPSYKPTKKLLINIQNGCSGSYFVSGYTRKDGTKVDGYTRACYKHSGMGNAEKIAGQEKYKGKKLQDLSDDELQEAI